MSPSDELAALKREVRHLIYAIDRGHFTDCLLPVSAYVTPLRAAIADRADVSGGGK